MSPYKISRTGYQTASYTAYRSMLVGNDVYFPPFSVFASVGSSPYIHGYNWTNASGFGTKYSNPATLPSYGSSKVYAKNNALFMGYFQAIAYSFTQGSFGTKYANPSNSYSAQMWVFNSNNSVIFFSDSNSPYVYAYPWTNATGFGTKYSNPATLPSSGNNGGIDFNYTTGDLAVGGNSSPYISTYKWTDVSGFGTKYSDPATLPTSGGTRGVQFNKSGNVLMTAAYSSLTPTLSAYPWSSSSGFGTRYADPAVGPGTYGQDVIWNSNGQYLFVGTWSGLSAYNWSSGFGTKFTAPASNATYANQVALSADEKTIFSADGYSSGSSGVNAWPWSASGFGTKYSNPATNITQTNGLTLG